MAKSLKGQVAVIMLAMREEMRNRRKVSNPLNQIFGQRGCSLMETICGRLFGMPNTQHNDDELVSRILKDNFVEFLDLYDKYVQESRAITIREQVESLEILRSNIAAINVMASAGRFHDPDYEIATKTNHVASELARDIDIIKQLRRKKTP